MTKPERQIGVVVPTLNGAATLDWTLCSLRSQRDIAVEILVADSGSTDGTLDICKRWDVKTTYVPPGNMYRAVNSGLRLMNTRWLTYLNADDFVYPDAYPRLIDLGEKQRASLVYGDCDYVDHDGRFLFSLKSPPLKRVRGVLRTGLIGFAQPAAIFRKIAYDGQGGFDERYRHIADYDFFYRLTFSDHTLAYLARPAVACFRVHPSQLSTREANVVRTELASFRKEKCITSRCDGIYDMACWRLRNSPVYLRRLIRQGHFRQSRIMQQAASKARAQREQHAHGTTGDTPIS